MFSNYTLNNYNTIMRKNYDGDEITKRNAPNAQ